MTNHPETYFEFFDGGDLLRVEPYEAVKGNSLLDWDRNWVKSRVTIKCGGFSGQFSAEFMTTDYELLKRGFKMLDRDFNGTVKFEPLEGQLNLTIPGDVYPSHF